MTARLSARMLGGGIAALVVLSSSAVAQDWGRARLNRALSIRDVFYTSDPKEPPSNVHVAGEVAIFGRNRKARSNAGKGKAAVVLNVKNTGLASPWEIQEIRLTTSASSRDWPYAFRSVAPSIPRGTAGTMAVVMDLSTYDPDKDGEALVLEVYRMDGYLQVSVALPAREYINR